MFGEYKIEKQLFEVIQDDEGAVHLALETKDGYFSMNEMKSHKGICESCGEVTIAKLDHAERWTNIEDSEEVQYELIYNCEECKERHGSVQTI